jgi:hypothetical protein
LAGQALGVERGAGVSVLIAPDLGTLADPDHVVGVLGSSGTENSLKDSGDILCRLPWVPQRP